MRKVLQFLIFVFVGLGQAAIAQSIIHPDSISVKSLKVTGLSGSGDQLAYISANGTIIGKRSTSVFIPAAAFPPVNHNPNFHDDGGSCYLDIGTTYNGLLVPVSLSNGVTIKDIVFYVSVAGRDGKFLICALKNTPFHANHIGDIPSA